MMLPNKEINTLVFTLALCFSLNCCLRFPDDNVRTYVEMLTYQSLQGTQFIPEKP